MKAHTKKWRYQELEVIKEFINSHPVIAIASLQGFPAALFAKVRKKLAGKADIRVSKVRVIKKALQDSKLKDSKIIEYSDKNVAIIGTSMNPFELYAFLKKSKGKISAKPGVEAPFDIIVPAIDTGLPPGPALSELKGAGLQVKIEGATIKIAKEAVVAKQGEAIPEKVCSVLQKLDIKPISVGLNITAALENNQVYLPEVLNIDEEQTLENIIQAFNNSLNLAVFAGIFNSESLTIMVQKAFREAKAVSLESDFVTSETAGEILAKAQNQASALKGLIKE